LVLTDKKQIENAPDTRLRTLFLPLFFFFSSYSFDFIAIIHTLENVKRAGPKEKPEHSHKWRP